MHVLHLPISLPRRNSPTSGIYIKRLAEAQRNAAQFERSNLMGLEIRPFFKNLRRILRRKEPAWLLSNDADHTLTKNVHTLRRYNKRHNDGAIKYAHEMLKFFETYVDRWGTPDIIHAHSGRGAGLAAAFVRITHGVPFVVTEHNPSFINDELDRDINQLRFVYNETERLFVVSKGMTEGVRNVGEYHTTVFPHVLAEPFVEEVPRDPPERPYFLSVGRLSENRNQQLAIKALQQCREKFDRDCELRIAGTGKKEGELRSLVADLDLNHAVEFLGHVPHEELRHHYTNATATLTCSHYETFSVPVIESLGCGCPVISTPVSGPESIAETVSYGVSLRERNSVDFAEEMNERLMTDLDRERIRSLAMDHYSPEVIAEFSFEQYQECLADKQ